MSVSATKSSNRGHRAGIFDIRNIIGALLGIDGVIILLVGIFGDAEEDKTGGVNANLWAGLVLVVMSAIFLTWAWLRPVVVPDDFEADDDEGGPVTDRAARSARPSRHRRSRGASPAGRGTCDRNTCAWRLHHPARARSPADQGPDHQGHRAAARQPMPSTSPVGPAPITPTRTWRSVREMTVWRGLSGLRCRRGADL